MLLLTQSGRGAGADTRPTASSNKLGIGSCAHVAGGTEDSLGISTVKMLKFCVGCGCDVLTGPDARASEPATK